MDWDICWQKKIGTGGQGSVYLARESSGNDTESLAPVYRACKVGKVNVLRKEALLLKQLKHPGFAHYEAYWEQRDMGFLVMEYVQGRTLEDYLRKGRINMRQMDSWCRQLAEALLALHHLPIPRLYRDLKPANIIIRTDGRLKLVDLGCVCSLAEAGDSVAGTHGYHAPEQLLAPAQVTEASDLYGFGKLLEQLLEKCHVCSFWERIRYRRYQRFCRECLREEIELRPFSVEQFLINVQKI